MPTIRSFTSYNHQSLPLPPQYGSRARNRNPSRLLEISITKHGCYLAKQWMRSSNIISRQRSQLLAALGNNLPPPPPNPPSHHLSFWLKWILGSIVSIALPFLGAKGAKLLKLERDVEKVADLIENTAEVVEDVAEAVETASSEVADKLPEDGLLKDAALFVKHVSKEVGDDAERTLDFIHKVDELKEDIEDLVEPFFDQEDDKIKKRPNKEPLINQEQTEMILEAEKPPQSIRESS